MPCKARMSTEGAKRTTPRAQRPTHEDADGLSDLIPLAEQVNHDQLDLSRSDLLSSELLLRVVACMVWPPMGLSWKKLDISTTSGALAHGAHGLRSRRALLLPSRLLLLLGGILLAFGFDPLLIVDVPGTIRGQVLRENDRSRGAVFVGLALSTARREREVACSLRSAWSPQV